MKAAQEAGARTVARHNGKVDEVSGLYKGNPELYSGLQTFKVAGAASKKKLKFNPATGQVE
jgi:hypothetical protein